MAVLLVMINLTPATPLYLILILCVLAGIGVSAAHVIPWAIIPDAIEYGELKTGERHEGMFYSLISLSQKVASSVAIPLALLVLDRTGYIPNSVQQPCQRSAGHPHPHRSHPCRDDVYRNPVRHPVPIRAGALHADRPRA